MHKILIIDDAATVRMYHQSILEATGCQIDEAVNGIEALEKALETQYDLYFVDVNMPKMDGYQFLRELRAQPQPQAPAIMVSTEDKDSDRQRAYEAGANYYLVKPVQPQDMLALARLLILTEEPSQ